MVASPELAGLLSGFSLSGRSWELRAESGGEFERPAAGMVLSDAAGGGRAGRQTPSGSEMSRTRLAHRGDDPHEPGLRPGPD